MTYYCYYYHPWLLLEHLSSFLLFSTTAALIIPLLLLWRRSRSTGGGANLPPGPPKYPIIGNLHLIAAGSGAAAPHRTLRELAGRYGPVMHMKLGQVPTLVVSSPEAAKEILSTHDSVFANRPVLITMWIISSGYTDIVFSPCSPYWRNLRKICTLHLLTLKRVQSFRSIREHEAHAFISSLRSSSPYPPFNFQRKAILHSMGVITRIAFGEKNQERDSYVEAITEMFKHANLFGLVDVYPSLRYLFQMGGTVGIMRRIKKEMDRIVQVVISDHRVKRAQRKATLTNGDGDDDGEEDLVDVFLNVQEQNDSQFSLTDDGVITTIHDIFTAGSDTSATTMEWAMAEMIKSGEAMKRAQEEVRRVFWEKGDADELGLDKLVYLKAVIKETLRLHPPAPLLIPRESTEGRVVSGYDIPARTRVIVNAWAIARDPRFWADPDRFHPDRFLNNPIEHRGLNYEYLPFGAGRRMCPGIEFSKPIVELLLAQLLFHFDWKLGNGEEEVDMEEEFSIVMRKKKPLILLPIPHHF